MGRLYSGDNSSTLSRADLKCRSPSILSTSFTTNVKNLVFCARLSNWVEKAILPISRSLHFGQTVDFAHLVAVDWSRYVCGKESGLHDSPLSTAPRQEGRAHADETDAAEDQR
jgi:hypothetical protein